MIPRFIFHTCPFHKILGLFLQKIAGQFFLSAPGYVKLPFLFFCIFFAEGEARSNSVACIAVGAMKSIFCFNI